MLEKAAVRGLLCIAQQRQLSDSLKGTAEIPAVRAFQTTGSRATRDEGFREYGESWPVQSPRRYRRGNRYEPPPFSLWEGRYMRLLATEMHFRVPLRKQGFKLVDPAGRYVHHQQDAALLQFILEGGQS